MGKAAQKQEEIEREDRRRKVAAYLLSGVTDQRAIAEHLDSSQPTISRDIKVVLAQWRQDAADDIEAAKGQDLSRINRMIAALWNKAIKGDLAAIAEVRNLIKRRAEIFGYDAPKRIESKYTVEVRKAAEQVAVELGLSVEEVLEEADRVIRGVLA